MWNWVVLFDAVQDSFSVWCLIQRFYAFSQLLHFISWFIQIVPLMGKNGLDPVDKTIEEFQKNVDKEYWDDDEEQKKNFAYFQFRFLRYPTVFWLSSSDFALKVVCILGIISSFLIMVFLHEFQVNFPFVLVALWWANCLFSSSISQVANVFGLKTEPQAVEGSFTFGLANLFCISIWKSVLQYFLTDAGKLK